MAQVPGLVFAARSDACLSFHCSPVRCFYRARVGGACGPGSVVRSTVPLRSRSSVQGVAGMKGSMFGKE